ncbi:C4-dicarboxylate ABC transporter [Bordetella avium]|uniref:SLAC1 anion channel family protein n=1 Tax=Bordetella avium TaxID=521 RepID=UPI000FD9C256|nr:SLAC1 anion channel family protein [Bordetella avium]AZY49560.1 C4-dicarboxylate ABC transporter [Bordetella avium]
MSAPASHDAPTCPRAAFDYLPVGFFSSSMGLAGLSVAWHEASNHYGVPLWIAHAIGILAVLAFLAVLCGYGCKVLSSWQVVKEEFLHPVGGSLFATLWIALLLLPIIVEPWSRDLALALWVIGACGMTLFAVVTVNRWISNRQQLAHATPAWIIPVVGMLDLPLAMPTLGLQADADIALFALALGLFFSLPLFTMIFSRLLFEAPMPDGALPSLLILVAPFAVGYSAYVTVSGGHDRFSESLYMLMLFMLLALLRQMRNLISCCPFRISWWAVGFPLAASAICALREAAIRPGLFTNGVAILLLAIATIAILGLLWRTLKGMAQGELRALSA